MDAGTYTELGYTTASADLSGASGVHNVYLVFKNANARVEGIQFVTSGVMIPDGLANEADENGTIISMVKLPQMQPALLQMLTVGGM